MSIVELSVITKKEFYVPSKERKSNPGADAPGGHTRSHHEHDG